MPPKQRITREMILEKSFEIFSKSGMEAVNARSVAKALNCSTQPIFSYFAGMGDLKGAIDQKAREVFDENIASSVSGENMLEDECALYIRYAKEQPRQFAHLFLSDMNGDEGIEALKRKYAVIREQEMERLGLNEQDADAMIVKMYLFAHGIAAAFASGSPLAQKINIEEQLSQMHEILSH